MSEAPIAAGRDCEMFDAGPGRLLRRARDGRSIAAEAQVIDYVHKQGFPVPEIYDVSADGTEITMERIDGPTMGDVAMKQPWKLAATARRLADLHDQLHQIPAPTFEWFRSAGPGDRLLHLDFHPLNVILGPKGPVVIDWMNAASGDPMLDNAVTYVLLTCPEIPGPRWMTKALQPARPLIANPFAKRYRGRHLDEQLDVAGKLKALDDNMTPAEKARCLKVSAAARKRLAAAG